MNMPLFNRPTVVAAAAAACLLSPIVVSAQTNPFQIVASPNAAPSNNMLKGVAALSPSDVWAVGFYMDTGTGAFRNLAMHWNGSTWTITPATNSAQPFNDQLKKVAAVSSTDVWAVGGAGRSTIFRWTGAQWTQVPRPPIVRSPGFNDVSNDLDDIAVVSANDIWAVGWLDALNGGQWTLTLHWDGLQWTQIPSPNVNNPSGNPYSQRLESVVALASDNVWAVGFYWIGNVSHPLIMNWNGNVWNIVPAPNGPTGNGWLHSIAAASPNDIWAVGEYDKNNPENYGKPLAMHWNGAAWTVVATPNPANLQVAPLYSVVARGPNDFVAVGAAYNSDQGFEPFALRWSGEAWTQVPAEQPPSDSEPTPPAKRTGWNQFLDVARDSSGGLWAVGSQEADSARPRLTLVERSLPAPGVTLSSVSSRKFHTDAGNLDVALPISGTPGVESRTGGANGTHNLVFSFAQPLTSVGGATVSSGTGQVMNSGIDPSNANVYLVNLGGVADAQRIVVTLVDVTDSSGNSSPSVQVTMDVLAGDTSADRVVNAGDSIQVRNRAGQSAGTTNARWDVNLDGAINSGDATFVKGRSGNNIP